MLNRFSEMIKQGIAPSTYNTETFTHCGTFDSLSRLYNNVWGLLTDTTMIYKDDQYVINGSLIKQPEKFIEFLKSPSWGACVFKVGTGKYDTFEDVMKEVGLRGDFAIQNGDNVYILSKIK